MKITGSIRTAYVQSPKARARADKSGSQPPKGERVEVSRAARELAAARAPETPDTARVERLRAAIADGSFEVDPDAIAEQMLKEELE